MKLALLMFFILSLLYSSCVFGEKPNVQLVISPIRQEIVNENDGDILYRIHFKMTIKNCSLHPVLLFTEEKPFVVGTLLAGTPEKMNAGSYLVVNFGGPSVDTSPRWNLLAANLLEQPLSKSGLVKIQSGATYGMFEDVSFVLYTFNESRWPKNATLNELRMKKELWFSVILYIWPDNLAPPNSETSLKFGKKVRKHWKKEGVLLLDNLMSDPIPFDLEKGFTLNR